MFKDYRYDNRGNLIEVNSGGKVFNSYQFDPRNQLVEVTNKHKELTKYTYDGLGNRVKTAIDLDRPGNGRPGNAYGHDKNKNNNGNNGNGNGHGHDIMKINYVKMIYEEIIQELIICL